MPPGGVEPFQSEGGDEHSTGAAVRRPDLSAYPGSRRSWMSGPEFGRSLCQRTRRMSVSLGSSVSCSLLDKYHKVIGWPDPLISPGGKFNSDTLSLQLLFQTSKDLEVCTLATTQMIRIGQSCNATIDDIAPVVFHDVSRRLERDRCDTPVNGRLQVSYKRRRGTA